MQPRKHGIDVIIGIGKPRGPMPPRPGSSGLQNSPAPNPLGSGPNSDPDGDGQKASADDAQVFDSTQGCGACANFDAPTGSCSVVEGQFSPTTGCINYFEPKNGAQSPGGLGGNEQPNPAPDSGQGITA